MDMVDETPEQSADESATERDGALTTILEMLTVLLLSVFLFACWPAAALLPWVGLAGFLAWSRGGWGRS